MPVHNMMEEIVRNCLKDLIQHKAELAALTDKQQDDIMAITLNKLPPKYVSTQRGELFVKMQQSAQVSTDIYRELTHAIERVRTTD
ncbi:late competence development ComFB family protein [Paenibacillus koleovorans]|uniref:late competence development ComFB family protein n=1 Tax=Paenibacillus koleovorans TaxID=121608 RepID=UPI000FD8B385|nr:late competence development ComFB family protein [Paenibacillus koleovorans]